MKIIIFINKLLFSCSSGLIVSLMVSCNICSENLGYLSTEQYHSETVALSHVMHKDVVAGLKLLHQVDKQVVIGLQEFLRNYYDDLICVVNNVRANNGRCFLVGAGSSGRIAVDIAARCSSDMAVIGIIAGGDSAFIRAREGFEDSESAGEAVMLEHHITSQDLVILISASGSSSFNVGCAQQARKMGATVYYFYNNTHTPAKTQVLFDQLGVIPIVVDSGPQAIAGSTRLQAASVARLALGSLFVDESPQVIVDAFIVANDRITKKLCDIARIIQLEHAIFANPESNFRKIKDESEQGYVTFVGDAVVLRDIVMDTVETAPTFSTNPPRMLCEIGKKRTELQAYLVSVDDNVVAWQKLIGRSISGSDRERSLQFLITEDALLTRPLGQGTMLVGVAWESPVPLTASFARARQHGAKTALILLSEHAVNDIFFDCDVKVILDCLPHDSLGLISAIVLKQVLNMISNGAMILMNKVEGNQMIDVNASNNKLIDRAVRLVQKILADYNGDVVYEYEAIELCICGILCEKKEHENNNIYTPSPVKIAVIMLHKKICFEEAITLLRDYEENLDRVILDLNFC